MVLDGAVWHQTNDLEIPENMKLVRLPPYSLSSNPTEHLWDEILEKWFPNLLYLLFKTLDAVEDVVEKALHFFEHAPERVASMTGFDWISSIPLIAT